MARKESEDYVEGVSGFALEAELIEEIEEVEEEETSTPSTGPVFTRGPGGKLIEE